MRVVDHLASWLVPAAASLTLMACGPSAGGGEGGGDGTDGGGGGGGGDCVGANCLNQCPSGTQTTISGIVTMPNGIDPVPGAIVYVPRAVSEFPDGVRCEICDTITDAAIVSTTTDYDGTFTLGPIPTAQNAPPNFEVSLVAQKGRFRKLATVTVANPCEHNTTEASSFRMPSRTNGYDAIPNIAVASGDYDVMECVLLKIGIDHDAFDIYDGLSLGSSGNAGTLDTLLMSLEKMKEYNIIFLNCANDTYESLLDNQQIRQNIEQYVLSGGRLYVTDWSYDYIEQVETFAPIIDFAPDASGPTPETRNAAAVGTGGLEVDAQVHDDGLARWLRAVETVTGQTLIDAQNRVHVTHFLASWVMQYMVQTSDTVKVWLTGQVSGSGLSGDLPLTTTFDYAQCGRVLYSSYHTLGRDDLFGTTPFPNYCSSSELSPQERVLEYLILHVADCIAIE